MLESKARAVLRELAATGTLAPLPADVTAPRLVQAACDQGVAGLLLQAIEREGPSWAAPVIASLGEGRRACLVRTLGQIGLAARTLKLLESRGVRGLPLKGVALAETVYDVESDRPMSDVDVLALERWPEARDAFLQTGFALVARGDHAWAFRDPGGAGIVELHRSVVSAPGLFPLDVEAVWARSRRGRGQLEHLPSAEDLLVHLALHAAFQHGLTLSLVQWLDFRRLLEREPIDASRLREIAAACRAEVPLAAALLAAEAVVKAPVPASLRRLPASLLRWLEPRLAEPLSFVGPSEPPLARLRWELLPGRRLELLRRTLVLPETPDGDERLPARLAFAFGRGVRLARRLPPEQSAPDAHDLGEPGAVPDGSEVPFGEEVLRDCLATFPQVRLTVTGSCMEPALRHGEKVLLVGSARRRPRLGDVVLARQSEALRLHRLVWGPPLAGAGSPWRTKADRGLRLDPPVAAADVIASVAAVEGRPEARPRRAARALLSLAGGIVARLRMGGAARTEAAP